MKLFGQSRIGQPVRINSDPYVPKSDQQMAVLGWGSTDAVNMNAHSDVLLETDAYYIPNDVCKTFEGTFRDYFIDFEQVVINATLCAMDFEDLSDSCRGDSGGPLIIKGESADEDLLVGLVSAGYVFLVVMDVGMKTEKFNNWFSSQLFLHLATRYGCANPNLPALYARISEADPWIRDMVCQYSENPPLDFGCPLSDTLELVYPCENLPIGRDNGNFSASTRQSGQYPPCTVLQPLINVTLTLRLDTRPEERGWLLRSKNDEGKWRSIVERPIFSYSDVEPLSTVTESLTLWDNREYEIVVLDSFGDGQDLDATDSMVLGISSRGHVLLSVNDFSGSNMHHSSFGFTVGIPATVAPTQTMAPSVSMTPTSAPTEPRPFISLVLEFGSFPQNMGFRLEVLEDYKELGEFDRPGIDNYTLMHVVYPGSFGPEDEGARIKVEIPLKGERTIIHTYRFTMTSNEGFGFSGGSYEVWLGPAMTGEFLFPGGNFYYEETHTFSIEPDGLAQAGSPTESPTSDGDTQSIGAASSVAVTFCLFLLVAWLPVLVL